LQSNRRPSTSLCFLGWFGASVEPERPVLALLGLVLALQVLLA
jgi:hypothetical protein